MDSPPGPLPPRAALRIRRRQSVVPAWVRRFAGAVSAKQVSWGVGVAGDVTGFIIFTFFKKSRVHLAKVHLAFSEWGC